MTDTNNTIYIHYGHDKFIKEKVKSIKSDSSINPTGGLWGSPVDSDFGWKEFCLTTNLPTKNMNKSFKFKLTKDTNLYIIDNYSDLDRLPFYDFTGRIRAYDYEKWTENYDAIYLTKKGFHETRNPQHFHIFAWDCECILVMNPDCIIPVD